MKYVEGDLVKMACAGDFDVIVHGCNCFNTMGAGIAKTIKQTFPEAWKIDQMTKKGDLKKLGDISVACVNSPRYGKKNPNTDFAFRIVNAYTQYDYRHGKPIDYTAVRSCMKLIKKKFKSDDVIGMPMIGAGLAGGDWEIIEKIIKEELDGYTVVVVVLK